VTDGAPSIVAEGFGWTYRTRRVPALRDVTFRVEPGQVLLVLGPSGCGKSSLARALAGLVPHVIPGTWAGRLAVGDLDVASTPAARLGERVGLVFQDPESQLVMARVEDEVAFGLENRGRPLTEMRAAVPASLAAVGLAGFERHGTATLSGGEQQRLAIADVLAPRPGLLVFDEPTANLDPPGMVAVFETLADLAARREHTLVIVEHRLDAALPLADVVLLLDRDGAQLAFGPPDAVGARHAASLDSLGGWIPSIWGRWLRGAAALSDTAAATRPGEPMSSLAPASSSPRPVLRADSVTVCHPVGATGVPPPALEDVSLALRRSERVALVGPNGSGKSTLLFVLAGVRRPNRGRVLVSGAADATEVDPARLRSADLAARIGLVFQDPEIGFIARSVAGEVAASSGLAPDGAAVTEILGRFGLLHLADVDPFRLSQGEQRRLSLAAHALRPPRVLLLDEPTFGLDRAGSDAVVALLDALRTGGQAQLMATHDPRLLPACDRVVALEVGRIVFDGTPASFAADPPYRPATPWRQASGG
jgi:energy-coupling factor transport system ATP-binding protein